MEHSGIDVHKRESQICILTPEGEIGRVVAALPAASRHWATESRPHAV